VVGVLPIYSPFAHPSEWLMDRWQPNRSYLDLRTVVCAVLMGMFCYSLLAALLALYLAGDAKSDSDSSR
jgi:hypothetical protein